MKTRLTQALRRTSDVDQACEIGDDPARAVEMLTLPPCFLIKHALQAEYSRICRNPIDGIYIVPSATDEFCWFGVVFIRAGVFAGGIFRFTVHVQNDFPNTTCLPKIIFDLPIFHPHISEETNSLDLTRYFTDGWKKEKHHLQYALLVAQRVFFSSLETEPDSCSNAQAARLWRDDRSKFIEIAKDCVNTSRVHVYDDPDTQIDPNYIKFTPWDSSFHEKTRLRMRSGPSSAIPGLSWLDTDSFTCMVEPLQKTNQLQPAEHTKPTLIERLDFSGLESDSDLTPNDQLDTSKLSSRLPTDIEEIDDV